MATGTGEREREYLAVGINNPLVLLFFSINNCQDLTRLEVAIPYLPHMCEDALRERRGKLKRTAQTESTTSFDQGAKIKLEEMDEKDSSERKRDSVGR